MILSLDVDFMTTQPLTQSQGVELWSVGYYFNSIGACTYNIKSIGSGDTLLEGSEGFVESIEKTVQLETPNVTVSIIKLSASMRRP